MLGVIDVPVKRKSRGRHKGKSAGHVGYVQCFNCGARIPIDKAIKRVYWRSIVSGPLARELEKQGAFVPRTREVRYYCIRCAIYLGIARMRARDERKQLPPELLQKRLQAAERRLLEEVKTVEEEVSETESSSSS